MRRSIAKHYKSGGIIGAVRHGPAALVAVEIDGEPLVKGKQITGFTNAEEDAVKLTAVMPFLLESELRKLGAEFVGTGNFQNNVVVEGRLVTGQNPVSANDAARAIVAQLNASSAQ